MGLKEQLDSAGYDTSSLNEGDLIKKLDSAGYDTSKYAEQSQSPEVDKQAALVASLTSQQIDPSVIGAQEKKLELMKAGKELPYSLGDIRDTFNTPGERIATGLASKGVEPHISAAVGTAFQMIPHVAASLPGGKAVEAGME